MRANLLAVEESTVAGLGRLAGFFGFSELMGRLYGTLLLSPEAMSLDDLAEALQISKGSVSMNMRSLERWGMAKEVWMAESDFWTVIRNVLSGREMREVQVALQVLEESVDKLKAAEDELPPEEQELAVYTLERIDDLRAFFQLALLVLETFMANSDDIDFEEISKYLPS